MIEFQIAPQKHLTIILIRYIKIFYEWSYLVHPLYEYYILYIIIQACIENLLFYNLSFIY